MRSPEDIEGFFIDLELPFQRVDDGLWVVQDEYDHVENLVVFVAERVLSFRMKLFDVPADPTIDLFRRLLELNGTDMVHGAYGIEGDAVVLIDTLELESLDPNELRSTIEAFGLALTSHYQELRELIDRSN